MTKIEMKSNLRGFEYGEFQDANGVPCSIQKSSAACIDLIWLGCDRADPLHRVPGKGWCSVPMPDEYIANTRMHLDQSTVRALLPYLKRFADTGHL